MVQTVTIKVFGINKLQKFFSGIVPAMDKEIGQKATLKIVESGQRRIRYRYNVLGYGKSDFSTGHGMKSIKVVKTPRGWGLSVADYIRLLNTRISPHWVSMETIEAHQAHPGSTMFKKAPGGIPFTRAPILFRWKGPFITPALKALESDIPKILEMQLNRAMQVAQS